MASSARFYRRAFFPLYDENNWGGPLSITTPDEVPPLGEEEEEVSQRVLPAPLVIGGEIGTIAGSLIYGGSNHWVRPIGFILAGLFLCMAETTSYPIASASSGLILNMTSDFAELAT